MTPPAQSVVTPPAQSARPVPPQPAVRPAEPPSPATVARAAQSPAQPVATPPPTAAKPAETAVAQARTIEPTAETPRPRTRPAEPQTTAEPQPDPPAPPAPDPVKPAATGGGGKPQPNPQASALSQLGKLSGYGQKGSELGRQGSTGNGVAGGSPDGVDGTQAAFEARGSQIAQACLERAGAFRPTDHFTGAFAMRFDRNRRAVTIDGRPKMADGIVPPATLGKIEAGLSRCPDFLVHITSRPNMQAFTLNITTTGLGRRR